MKPGLRNTWDGSSKREHRHGAGGPRCSGAGAQAPKQPLAPLTVSVYCYRHTARRGPRRSGRGAGLGYVTRTANRGRPRGEGACPAEGAAPRELGPRVWSARLIPSPPPPPGAKRGPARPQKRIVAGCLWGGGDDRDVYREGTTGGRRGPWRNG